MKNRPFEILIKNLLRATTYCIVIFIGYILFDIIRKGVPAINWEFISGFPRKSGSEGGIFPAIVGTLYLLFGTMLTALPLGISSAVYLS